MQSKANALRVNGFGHVTWRYYNQIKKKAMDKEPGFSGLLISLSIAFFIVTSGALGLSLAYKVYLNGENGIINEKKTEINRWENAYQYIGLNMGELKSAASRLANSSVKTASAAELEIKGQTEKYTHYISAVSGKELSYTIKIKNTGKLAWKKDEVFLETGPALRRFSQFAHPGWPKYFRLGGLNKDVLPGKTAEIKFSLLAPAAIGQYQEDLQLVRNGAPIAGSLTRVFIDVTAPASAISSNSAVSAPAPASFSTLSVPAATSLQNSNNSKDFCTALNDTEKKQYEQCNTNANETSQGSGSSAAGNTSSSEPILRVGLFTTTNAQRVSPNGLYDIYSGKELIFSGLDQNSPATISFNFSSRQYGINVNGIIKTAASQVRVIPRNNGGVITLPDYEKRPAWNISLNDNMFRNIIEFQYSTATKKLWVINELPIESYLLGLAETSNISHIEFQKTLITAARTYALYHYYRGIEYGVPDGSTKHANEHFHIDSVYDQVYRGYGSEIRMPNLVKAVNDTRGMTVFYNNKIAITPYFSRSDGRTRSWTEVWGGAAMAWLQSVAVPEDQGQSLWGHGVGMSARGALLMANSGKLWNEILKYFYQGTDLKNLYN